MKLVYFVLAINFSICVAQNNFWCLTSAPMNLKVVSLTSNSLDYIFAAAEDSGVYRSTNKGVSWESVNVGIDYLFVMSVANSLNNELFAGSLGVYHSSNMGINWIQNGTLSAAVLCFLIQPGGIILVGTGGGIYRSTDNGMMWTKKSNGLPSPNSIDVWSLGEDNSGNIYAATSSYGVFKSSDNGNNWVEKNNGLSTIYARTIAVNSLGHLFVGTSGGGIFLSTNGGDSWSHSGAEGIITAIIINSKDDIYVGGYSGILRSSDNGNNWVIINEGFTNLNIRSLSVDSSGFIYAGTEMGGIFKSIESTISSIDAKEYYYTYLRLEQNYPNPFNPSTRIEYQVSSNTYVTLKAYDVLGMEVATLVNEEKEAGIYRAEFNKQDYQLASGIYLYRLQAGNYVETKKMVLIK